MRNLTGKQKKMLREWFNENYPDNTGHCKFDLADKIDIDIYNEIDAINPCEVFYQNVNNYLETLVDNKE